MILWQWQNLTTECTLKEEQTYKSKITSRQVGQVFYTGISQTWVTKEDRPLSLMEITILHWDCRTWSVVIISVWSHQINIHIHIRIHEQERCQNWTPLNFAKNMLRVKNMLGVTHYHLRVLHAKLNCKLINGLIITQLWGGESSSFASSWREPRGRIYQVKRTQKQNLVGCQHVRKKRKREISFIGRDTAVKNYSQKDFFTEFHLSYFWCYWLWHNSCVSWPLISSWQEIREIDVKRDNLLKVMIEPW